VSHTLAGKWQGILI